MLDTRFLHAVQMYRTHPRRWVLLCLVGAALVATSTNARAVSIFLENVTVNPGDSVTLGVFLDAEGLSDIAGFQTAALIPGSAAAGLDISVSQPEDFLPNAGSPPDFYQADRQVDTDGAGDLGVSAGVVVDFFGTNTLFNGINRVLDVTVTVPNTVPLGTVFDFPFVDGVLSNVNSNGTFFIDNAYIIDGLFVDFDSLNNGTITVIPEPSTMLLLGSGLAGLGFVRQRKSATSQTRPRLLVTRSHETRSAQRIMHKES